MQPQTTDVQTRTILPPRRDQSTLPVPCQRGPRLGGDELRARAWLWRHFGIGTHASGGAA